MATYVFKRNEAKYKLSPSQYSYILSKVQEEMNFDKYGETTIQSLYYDTDTDLLIRNSIERPLYKEKLRLRSYGLAKPDSQIFIELKKKSNKIVFKRRIAVKESEIDAFFQKQTGETQIEKEILYFRDFYGGLKPKMLLLYDRIAFVAKDDSDLRITFDKRIRYRTNDLNLCSSLDGTLLMEEGEVLMEIKTGYAYPMWLVKLLSEQKAYKTSYSKYGNAYKREFVKRQEIKNDEEMEARVI